MSIITTTLTVRNILKKNKNLYKKYTNKAVAFCFDIWSNFYITKTGERGKILEINNVPVDVIIQYNMFTPETEYTGHNLPGFDRVKLETVARYSNNNGWFIIEPQYNPANPAPYMATYNYLKIISSYPNNNPITGLPLNEGEVFIDNVLKGVVFGFIDNEGTVKDIQGTCGNNITIKCESGYVPIKLTGCRLDISPTRIDCESNKKVFDFTSWNNRPNWNNLILGDIPISK